MAVDDIKKDMTKWYNYNADSNERHDAAFEELKTQMLEIKDSHAMSRIKIEAMAEEFKRILVALPARPPGTRPEPPRRAGGSAQYLYAATYALGKEYANVAFPNYKMLGFGHLRDDYDKPKCTQSFDQMLYHLGRAA